MFTLVLDTSGSFTTVLISRECELTFASILQGRPAEHVHEQIEGSLAVLHIQPQDLGQIAVVIGPGSWTGLNIDSRQPKLWHKYFNSLFCQFSHWMHWLPILQSLHGAIMNAGRNRCYHARYSKLEKSAMAVESIESVLERIKTDTHSIRILEYGKTFEGKFEKHTGYHSSVRLSPEGLITAMKRSSPIEGDAIKALTPAYLQPSHAERMLLPRPSYANSRD